MSDPSNKLKMEIFSQLLNAPLAFRQRRCRLDTLWFYFMKDNAPRERQKYAGKTRFTNMQKRLPVQVSTTLKTICKLYGVSVPFGCFVSVFCFFLD